MHRPGKVQRAIIEKMAAGYELCHGRGWYLRHGGNGLRAPVDSRAAAALRDYGYVMFDCDLALEGAARYVLTEQGKAAL